MTGRKMNRLLVVVGSAYANVVVHVQRLPAAGETLLANSGTVTAGGKGAVQSACAARLSCPTHLVAQIGKNGHGAMIKEALASAGVILDHIAEVCTATGQSVVMMDETGMKTSVLLQGANVSWPRLEAGIGRLQPGAQQIIRCAAALLLQREVPDAVNLEAAKIAKSSNIPVILDSSGSDSSIPEELLKYVTVLCSTMGDLARIPGSSIANTDEAIVAARKCIIDMGIEQVLIKLKQEGLVLVTKEEVYVQSVVPGPHISFISPLADDVLTSAYAVAFVEGQLPADALLFSVCAAASCARSKVGIASLPDRKTVMKIVQEN